MVDKYTRYGINNNKKLNSEKLSAHEEYEIKEVIQRLKQKKMKNLSLKKQNNELYNEILILKSNIRSQISFFQKTKGNYFPSFETLKNKINNFLKIDCFNFFKDYLFEEYEIEGVEIFYREVFKNCEKILKEHFILIEEKLDLKFKDKNIRNTLDCVLKNSYQVDWKRIMENLIKENYYKNIMIDIQNSLDIGEKDERVNNDIIIFIKKAMEIIFQCFVNQPKIYFDVNRFGNKVSFNKNKYEEFFGNISEKEYCKVILPSFIYYNEVKKKEEKINKEKVMKPDFFENKI
jgi:hypothetical protein